MVSVTSVLPADNQIDEQGIETWLNSIAADRDGDEMDYLRAACMEALHLYGASEKPTGEKTILYVLHVADILNHLKMDVEALAAALLHEAVGSIGFDERRIEGLFGKHLLDMIKNMARIGMVASGSSREITEEQHIENLRRMLLGIASDVRVVLVVLAERVHIARMLKYCDEATQRRMALETRDIYAPLANRLGVWQLKWELEDLSLRYLEPEKYMELAKSLKGRRHDRENYIHDVISLLHEKFSEHGIQADISGRPKHIYSIWKKMQRKNVDFDQIFDVLAVRVMVDTIAQCYEVLGIVHGIWRHIPGEFDDYIATPKANHYQSLHTAVIDPEGKPLEIQVRTYDMHDHAERGVAAHWRYKENRGQDEELEKRIEWMRNWLELKEEGLDDSEFVGETQDAFESSQIYVLTPQGKVIELPEGSTPVDFAYAIHTDVGHRCRGAKVDGKIVTLNSKLESGHSVEILTVKQGGPSRDWLNMHLGYCKTSRARGRIRQWFKHQDYEEHIRIGRSSLEREINRLGLHQPDLDKIAERFHQKNSEDLLAAIGRGDVSPIQVAACAHRRQAELPLNLPPSQTPRRKSRSHKKLASSNVIVDGVGDLLTTTAKCCKPVPYDPIVGYITKGRGITIHRRDCSMIKKIDESGKERLINVIWADQKETETGAYPVDIRVYAIDRKGLLRDISSILSTEDVDVVGVKTHSDKKTDRASMKFTIEIINISQLSRVMEKISQLPDIIEVKRQIT
ncbi:MAG: bifunctional (p)ppGpp synthetase/guanosine-3',5'-bis(diphosphate) 3'-pyrophosphohydrolase [Gammaproteobacteria bacterium]|jgi:GTP pyrophosphokinase